MSFPKFIFITAFCLFGLIALLALFKKDDADPVTSVLSLSTPVEVALEGQDSVEMEGLPLESKVIEDRHELDEELVEPNRVAELFNLYDPQFPIVKTITYRSRVSWIKGRPAWLSDYASYYKTSRHFIACSLNGKPDYFKQDVSEGDRFNVYDPEKNLEFYLLVDISRCKLWLYYHDLDSNQRQLIRTYRVGLGRLDQTKASGSLTPIGKYATGDKVMIYKPKMYDYHHGEKIEMVRVFGSRWIPFAQEIKSCSAPAKGFGIHGVPWLENEQNELVPDEQSVGKYEGDGCIRLADADMQELFSIIITKKTTIEIVRDFGQAHLPRIEN